MFQHLYLHIEYKSKEDCFWENIGPFNLNNNNVLFQILTGQIPELGIPAARGIPKDSSCKFEKYHFFDLHKKTNEVISLTSHNVTMNYYSWLTLNQFKTGINFYLSTVKVRSIHKAMNCTLKMIEGLSKDYDLRIIFYYK